MKAAGSILTRLTATLLVLGLSTSVSGEPLGRWWSGYGQGTMEYGYKSNSAGRDWFYIACSRDLGTTIRVTAAGKDAPARSVVQVVIDGEAFELWIDESGEFRTASRVGFDTFRTLWPAIRRGRSMRVRLSSGQSAVIKLTGAAKALPRDPCETDYER